MYYFHISLGLRGCYMPDEAYVVKVKTRRELKAYLEYEAADLRDAGYIGFSKKAIATLAAECWRQKGKVTRDYVAPYKEKSQEGYPYGLFCSPASRAEWKEYTASVE